MELPLYPHNREAYFAASALLEEAGRAAVIHPTGTGKSMIGFQLAAAHPDKTVLWLSPSRYIYHTQCENLKKVCAYKPYNIQFLTYAKLLGLSDKETSALSPNYIILDEFHRCGAAEWGKGVSRLLERHICPVLGLSATQIRYLDHQRDMAQELFGGCIASEITLGEAIARGILQQPKYVVSIYSYQKELTRLERRVRTAKNQAVRDRAQTLLDRLRRSLSQAEGLDQMFARHMRERTGKYLVFCSSVAHLAEMQQMVPAWFSAVDPHPQIYTVLSQDASSGQAFRAFEQDQSAHLKLLFCIDMLNEGIHLHDISGVILFRPTVSPILYKQQIGRALSAGNGRKTVIFDVVNNFENLYTIGTLEEEVKAAAALYRTAGMQDAPWEESFFVSDDVRDSRRLFDELQDCLASSWDTCFAAAEQFYRSNGHLNVPKRYRTEQGISLGAWITTQRNVRAGKTAGILTPAQIKRLDAIGMRWENRYDLSWNRHFEAAKQYFEAHGHLDVPAGFVTRDGVTLGRWIVMMRQCRAGRIQQSVLTQERIAALDAMGMIWDKFSFLWEQYYLAAAQYRLDHRSLEIPLRHVTPEGLALGRWIDRMRRQQAAGMLSAEQVMRLEQIGMAWDGRAERLWNRNYEAAVRYYQRHGALDPPASYVTPDGIALGKWVSHLRTARRNPEQAGIKLTAQRIQSLDAIGMVWDHPDAWEIRFALALDYFEAHGELNIPAAYRTPDGIWLGKWLYQQRLRKRRTEGQRPLSPDQIRRLEEIGMDWLSPAERAWQDRYAEAEAYVREHGCLSVPTRYRTASGTALGVWLQKQRAARKNGKLEPWQVAALDRLGMDWKLELPVPLHPKQGRDIPPDVKKGA